MQMALTFPVIFTVVVVGTIIIITNHTHHHQHHHRLHFRPHIPLCVVSCDDYSVIPSLKMRSQNKCFNVARFAFRIANLLSQLWFLFRSTKKHLSSKGKSSSETEENKTTNTKLIATKFKVQTRSNETHSYVVLFTVHAADPNQESSFFFSTSLEAVWHWLSRFTREPFSASPSPSPTVVAPFGRIVSQVPVRRYQA